MCAVSMVGDEFSKKWDPNGDWWKKNYPLVPYPLVPNPYNQPLQQDPNQDIHKQWEKLRESLNPSATKQEVSDLQRQINELRKEVELMRDLLKAAKLYDEKNNEPSCEMESKVKLLKEMAKMMGVDLSDVFPEQLPVVTSGLMQVETYIIPGFVTTTTGGPYTIDTTTTSTVTIFWDDDTKSYKDVNGNPVIFSYTISGTGTTVPQYTGSQQY